MRIVCHNTNDGGRPFVYRDLSEVDAMMKVEEEISFLSRPEIGYKVERTDDGFIAKNAFDNTIEWTIKN